MALYQSDTGDTYTALALKTDMLKRLKLCDKHPYMYKTAFLRVSE